MVYSDADPGDGIVYTTVVAGNLQLRAPNGNLLAPTLVYRSSVDNTNDPIIEGTPRRADSLLPAR